MSKIDLILTLDDREARPSYNRTFLPYLKSFINHEVNTIVSIHQPTEPTLKLYKKYLEDGVIQRLETWDTNIGHSPADLNRVFTQAFRFIESDWVLHFDGDMLTYRRGHEDWLEKFIGIIERKEHNIGAITHTMPYNRMNPIHKIEEPRRQEIAWVSTRFFITEAETVKAGMIHPKMYAPWPDTYAFEGLLVINGLRPRGLRSLGMKFNPDFLIVHGLGMADWCDDSWDSYTKALDEKNPILLDNIAHSDWGDIHGGKFDIDKKNFWGESNTVNNDGEWVDLI